MRWLDKNHPVRAPKNQSPIDTVDFCQDVAKAVNAYADKKRAELEQTLKRVMMGALNDDQQFEDVRISTKELLESECMVFIVSRITAGIGRPNRVPANLN